MEHYLFKLYVSLGGGVSLNFSMTGIKERISFVMVSHSDPGPNSYGCLVEARKGVASKVMELTCASTISCEM